MSKYKVGDKFRAMCEQPVGIPVDKGGVLQIVAVHNDRYRANIISKPLPCADNVTQWSFHERYVSEYCLKHLVSICDEVEINGDISECGGKRFNQGKLQWSLLPFEALVGVVKVMMAGAKKYGVANWSRGMSWTICYDCAMRHLYAWRTGEDSDSESGESHLSHVICNMLFLIYYSLKGKGKDDRKVEF